MKKYFITMMMLAIAYNAFADKLSIAPFTISVGETKQIAIQMTMTEKEYRAVQFDLYLPEGVTIAKKKNGKEDWSLNADRIEGHSISGSLKEGGYYTIAIVSLSEDVFYEEEGDLMYIKVVASDQLATGETQGYLKNVNLAVSSTESTLPDDEPFICTGSLSTTITTLGYASFSWPKALDFSNSGLTAFIVTSCDGNTLHLESVTKVPANTGLILKGSENTYPLETTDGTTDDVSSNLLSSNTDDVYTVASDDIYVLSNLDGGQPGFYKADNGINVAKYKSYLQYSVSGARRHFSIEEQTTGITPVFYDASDTLYDLQGRRVSKPTQGVYIRNGKKIVIK